LSDALHGTLPQSGWVALASLRKGHNPFRDQEGRRISSAKAQLHHAVHSVQCAARSRRTPCAPTSPHVASAHPRTRGSPMRRRDVLSLLGGAAVSWPVGGATQQQPLPVIGYLTARAPGDEARWPRRWTIACSLPAKRVRSTTIPPRTAPISPALPPPNRGLPCGGQNARADTRPSALVFARTVLLTLSTEMIPDQPT
jgi:hypothetical protein